MIDRGAKRTAVWSDDEEEDREIELDNTNLNKKIRYQLAGNDTISGKDLEDKLRSQVCLLVTS